MSKILGMWMFLFMELILMMTPIMFYIDGMNKDAISTVLHEGAKQASIVGTLDESIKDEMYTELEENYNYDRSCNPNHKDTSILDRCVTIKQVGGIEGRKVERGEGGYITIEITANRNLIPIYDMFVPNSDGLLNKSFTQRTRIMSEYVGDNQ